MSKVVVLEDFLPEEQAEALADVINGGEFFEYAYKTGDDDILPKTFTAASKYVAERNAEEAKLKQSLVDGDFTYRQKRIIEHPELCHCAYCMFVQDTLKDPEFAQYIEALGDVKYLELVKHFASIYDVGDFLSIHKDPNYSVAFIFNLTKDWRYEYGGCLTVINEGRPEVILPKFNSLVLMFLGDEGIDHYVSEVSRLAPHPRIAISGWYNEKTVEDLKLNLDKILDL